MKMFKKGSTIFLICCLAAVSVTAVLNKGRDKSSEIAADCSKCGISLGKPSAYVINGTKVDPGTYPWLVSIDYRYCGGAIISDSYILTAAHCVTSHSSRRPLYFRKVYLQTSWPTKLSKGYSIKKILVHPGYSLFPSKGTGVTLALNDIALLELKEKIRCDEYRNSICLSDSNIKHPVGNMSIIAGWRETEKTKTLLELSEGRVKNVKFSECIKEVPEAIRLKKESFCEGSTNETLCYGDSGTPLVQKHGKKFYAVGVASSETNTSCNPKYPCIFMDVAKFSDWIRKEAKI